MDTATQHQNDPSRILEQARQHLEALKQAGLSREALIALLEEDDQPKQQQQLQIQLQSPPPPQQPAYQPPPPPQQQQKQQHSPPHIECKSDRSDAIRVTTNTTPYSFLVFWRRDLQSGASHPATVKKQPAKQFEQPNYRPAMPCRTTTLSRHIRCGRRSPR